MSNAKDGIKVFEIRCGKKTDKDGEETPIIHRYYTPNPIGFGTQLRMQEAQRKLFAKLHPKQAHNSKAYSEWVQNNSLTYDFQKISLAAICKPLNPDSTPGIEIIFDRANMSDVQAVWDFFTESSGINEEGPDISEPDSNDLEEITEE